MENEERKRLKEYEDKKRFDQRFRSQIKEGYTLEKLQRDYNTTSRDVEMFKELHDEIAHEKELGGAFLSGFNSFPTNNYSRYMNKGNK